MIIQFNPSPQLLWGASAANCSSRVGIGRTACARSLPRSAASPQRLRL